MRIGDTVVSISSERVDVPVVCLQGLRWQTLLFSSLVPGIGLRTGLLGSRGHWRRRWRRWKGRHGLGM